MSKSKWCKSCDMAVSNSILSKLPEYVFVKEYVDKALEVTS